MSFVQTQPESTQRVYEEAATSGLWLSVTPTSDSHTILSPTEFTDSLCLCYSLTPNHCPNIAMVVLPLLP